MSLRLGALLLVLFIGIAFVLSDSIAERSVAKVAVDNGSSNTAEGSPYASEGPSLAVRESNKQTIKSLLANRDIPLNDIEQFGYQAIPALTELYKEADTSLDKSRIAWVFWRLGWKSTEIEQALLSDLDAEDASLRVWAQWAIAKSSDNSAVIDKLIYNLKNDSSAYVRDKAACALASDFVHISPTQRVDILRGLIEGLNNTVLQVRVSSIQALKIQTGQTKNFIPTADAGARAKVVGEWIEWLDQYEQNL